MSERITLNRKEFEAFLAENQTLLERSEKLVQTIAALERTNNQLRQELRALKPDIDGENHRGDERLRRAREGTSRLLRVLNEGSKQMPE